MKTSAWRRLTAPHFGWLFLLTLTLLPGLGHSQTWQWALASAGTGSYMLKANAVAVDDAGTTIVAGQFSGTMTLGSTTLTSAGYNDVFVAWLSSAGVWTNAVRAGGSDNDQISGLALNGSNGVVVAGSFSTVSSFGPHTLTSAGLTDVFVARLSSTGAWTQAARAGGPHNDNATAVAVEAGGAAVVVGTFRQNAAFGPAVLNSAGNTDLFVARLSAAGAWTQAVGAGGANEEQATAVALEANGTAVVAGDFGSPTLALGSTSLGNGADANVFVGWLSSVGTWVRAAGSEGSGAERVRTLAVDGSGNVTVAGSFASAARFGATTLTATGADDAFVARLSPAGTWTLAASAGGNGFSSSTFINDILVDAAGNTIAVGEFWGRASSFGTFALTKPHGSFSPPDLFVATLSPAGTWTQAQAIGATEHESAFGVALDSRGDLTLAGTFSSPSVSFGSSTVTQPLLPNPPYTYTNVFVARLAGLVSAATPATPLAGVLLLPNPARSQVQVRLPGAGELPASIPVLDALGRELRRYPVPAHASTATLDLHGLAPGFYQVRVGSAMRKLVVE